MIDFNGFDWGDSSENFKNLLTREFSKHNSYEKFFQVEAGDIVVDLGASVGPFTWSILNKNPSQCYAVEALSKYLPILYNNIGRSNVKIFNYAIPISNEKFIEINWEGTRQFTQCVPFSEFLYQNRITKIDFLKCDCEGGEYNVFKLGNVDFLKRIPKIAAEFHIGDLKEKDDLRNKFIYFRENILRYFPNYKIYSIDNLDITSKLFDTTLTDYYKSIMIYIDNRN